MKARLLSLILFVFLINLSQGIGQQKEDFTIRFITLGSCYMCKVRVEAKVNSLEGVVSSTYDPMKSETTVTYDDLVTDAYMIMQAVADTGHDTEWYRAPDEAYELLIGTCCEYERTIDYSQVQIGYLSLMDLWVGHVGINNHTKNENVLVFPSITDGLINIDLTDLENNDRKTVSVFSLDGKLMKTFTLNGRSLHHKIDISNLPDSNYLLLISSNNHLISKSKILKR